MPLTTLAAVVALALLAAASAGAQQPSPVPEAPGVYADTSAGPIALKKTFSGIQIAGPMSGGTRSTASVFPIPSLDEVPTAPGVTGFLVNLATVQDSAAAGAQLRFAIGEHVREPDYQIMTVKPGKFRTGMYQITSPNLTHDWLSAAYAKLTSTRKWRDKHPPAIVGLIVNGEMYPVRIDTAWLAEK
jgi:hypothetical protein